MIQYFPTITGSLTVNGDLIVTGTGSMSASLALNSNLLQGTGSTGFATTASLTAVSSSQQQISASLLTLTASYAALSSSYTALSGSYTTFSGSASTRVTQIENTYATTGSNSFRANQSITGSLVVSSTITAQTLVVQTVTSSIVYSSGSNLFGSALGDRQTFTGSLNVTGSSHAIFGNVGIGIASPAEKIHVFGSSAATSPRILIQSHDTANATAGLTLYGRDVSNVNKVSEIATSGSDLTISVNSSERMRITSAGSVGIGTTAPFAIAATNLSVNGASAAVQLGYNGTRAAQFYADGAEARLYAVTNVPLRLGTNDTEVMRITGSLVGIGTTNPAQSLEVNGSILASSTGKIGFRYSSTDGNYYSYLRSATAGSIGPIVLAGGFESGGASNEAIRFVTNANPGERSAVSILNSGKVGIGTTGPTTQFQIRKNYWQFWDEKAHGSNVNMFSITLPDFGSAVITVAGSRYSPGADNYSGTSIFYIYITNVGAVSVNGGNTSGTWTPTTSVASKTVTFASAYAGSSTNYSDYSVVIQASGHSGGSESAAYVTIL